jgi:hypothetical protein
MPAVPTPEECEFEETHCLRLLESEKPPARLKGIYRDIISVSVPIFSTRVTDLGMLKERLRSPIAIKAAREHDISEDGTIRYMYWMQARDIPKYEAPFQKASFHTTWCLMDRKSQLHSHQCILSYISDLYLCAITASV